MTSQGMEASVKPKVIPEAIPACLRDRDQWLCWKFETRKDSKKPTKVPYQPEKKNKNGEPANAKTNDPSTWSPFERCFRAVDKFDGTGYAFASGDGFAGVDLDHCFDEEGKLYPWARKIVDKFEGTWIEYSPSGQGLHIWCQGKPVRSGKGTQNKSVELYDFNSPRYFTVTGNTFSGHEIVDGQESLDWLHGSFFEETPVESVPVRTKAPDPVSDDDENVRRALDCIPADDYELWLKVGMALKAGGHGCALWDWWSQKSSKYQAGICAKKWGTFKRTGVGVGSIMHIAEGYGFHFPRGNDRVLPFEKPKGRPEPITISENDPLIWLDPIKLIDVTDLPKLSPDSILPKIVADMCEDVAYVTQTPIELSVMVALAVVATCVQGKFVITPGSDWLEPVHVFAVCGAESGERKSAIFRHLAKPIVEWQILESERTVDTRNLQTSDRDCGLAKIKSIKGRYARTESPTELQSLKEQQAELQKNLPEEPVEPFLFGGETTAEGLQKSFTEHHGKWAILTDEGGIFQVLGGLYTNGRINLDTFLKAYSGDAVNVKRGGREVRVPNPSLTICVMCQPDMIRDLGLNRAFRGTGFLARFLYVQPASMIGKRDARRRIPLNDGTMKAYQKLITRLLDWKEETPRVITLTPQALDCFDAFSQWVEDLQKEGGRLYDLRDWASKLAGNALRVAALIHLVNANEFSEPVVNESEMRKANDLCTALIEHALYSFSTMAADPAIVDAKYLMEYLINRPNGRIYEGDLHNLYRFRESKKERLLETLTILVNKHVIKGPIMTGGRGRPGAFYLLNPKLLEAAK